MARKKPMGEQAVPTWGLWPWIEIVDEESELNFTLKEVLQREANRETLDEIAKSKSKEAPGADRS